MKQALVIPFIFLFGCGSGGPGFSSDGKFPKNVSLLIAGQSNGNSSLQDSALQVSLGQHELPYISPTGNVMISDPSNAVSDHFVPTIDKPAVFGLAWCYLSDMAPNHNFFITVVSQAGRSTQQQVDQELYLPMLAALKIQRYDAVLWIQGESDSGLHLQEQQTYDNMVFIINQSRFLQPSLVWYVALDCPSDPATCRAQARVIADGYALQGPSVDASRSNPAYFEVNKAEFSGAGLKEHGRLWYEILKSML